MYQDPSILFKNVFYIFVCLFEVFYDVGLLIIVYLSNFVGEILLKIITFIFVKRKKPLEMELPCYQQQIKYELFNDPISCLYTLPSLESQDTILRLFLKSCCIFLGLYLEELFLAFTDLNL